MTERVGYEIITTSHKQTSIMKKYEFTGETKKIGNTTVHRIRRISNGELGGWIEKEDNLSHEGNAWISGNARVFGNAHVFGNALISDNARVFGNAWISDNARVFGDVHVYGIAHVYGDARVYGNAHIAGNAHVSDSAQLKTSDDYMAIDRIGSESGTLTVYRTTDGIGVTRGCFTGSLEQFEQAVIETHGDNQYALEYMDVISLIKRRFNLIAVD